MSSRSYDRRDHRIRDDGKVGSIGHEGASASGSLVSSHARDSRRLEHDNGRYNGGHGRRSRSPADRARRRAGGEGKYYETRDGQERRRGGWPKEDAASRSSVRRDESSMDMYVTVGGKRPDSSIARRPNGDADLKQSQSKETLEEGELDTAHTSILSRSSAQVADSNGDSTDYELLTEEDEMRVAEERRRQRQAILARHQDASLHTKPVTSPAAATGAATAMPSEGSSLPAASRDFSTSPKTDRDQTAFELGKADDNAAAIIPPRDRLPAQEMSAAEYDPNMDRALDHEREVKLMDGAPQEEISRSDDNSEYEEIEFTDDDEVDDMFAIVDEAPKKKRTLRVKKGKGAAAPNASLTSGATAQPSTSTAPATLLDNWDDPDGYYRITLGERLGDKGRYHVFAVLGRGMFSSVVKARDTFQNDREVAIKVVRSQETMYKAGLKEIAMLGKLGALDPDDKRHVIRLIAHFDHRKHLCMVFESLSMNLREVVKRFGKNVGLNLQAVRAYAHQMFFALALMRKAEIMHADLKPDNILVNESKTALKVCDLGSASGLTEMEITPYLVSRFYRAPEIILGMPYDCAIDMWSIGCTLYELFTGKILFPGKSNNHMLQLMQELRGKFTTKQIRKGRFAGMHFDDMNAFVSRERQGGGGSDAGAVAGTDILRKVHTFNPTAAGTDLRSRLLPPDSAKTLSPASLRSTNSFVDLLGRALELDPSRRLTPTQALQHPFFSN